MDTFKSWITLIIAVIGLIVQILDYRRSGSSNAQTINNYIFNDNSNNNNPNHNPVKYKSNKIFHFISVGIIVGIIIFTIYQHISIFTFKTPIQNHWSSNKEIFYTLFVLVNWEIGYIIANTVIYLSFILIISFLFNKKLNKKAKKVNIFFLSILIIIYIYYFQTLIKLDIHNLVDTFLSLGTFSDIITISEITKVAVHLCSNITFLVQFIFSGYAIYIMMLISKQPKVSTPDYGFGIFTQTSYLILLIYPIIFSILFYFF